jgi:hypothetical protein
LYVCSYLLVGLLLPPEPPDRELLPLLPDLEEVPLLLLLLPDLEGE